jgi:hypothetical protein
MRGLSRDRTRYNRMDFLKRIPLHPYLLAGYSVLTLVALNMGKFAPWMAVRSLVFFILVIAILYWPMKWLTRSPYKTALVLTLFLAAFFTYGHIHNLLDGVRLVGINFSRHRTLVLIWAVILVAGVIWIALTRRNLQGVTQALNVILIIALCFPIFQITRYEIQSLLNSTHTVKPKAGDLSTGYPPLAVNAEQSPPDIYYIILDTYARQDTLQSYFKFDNSDFVKQLQALGFYVARCSQSNYATTELSLASSLNLNYLDVLGNNSKQIYTHPELYRLIQENETRQLLENAGYRVVAFASGFSPTDWKDADEYLTRENEPLKAYLLGGINSFESLELQTSAGLLLYADNIALPKTLRSFLDGAFTEHRERILYAFNRLATVPQMPGSKFVFVHILAPHSPFVFGAKGEIVGRSSPFTLNNDLEIADPKLYIQGYRNQIQYINHRTLQLLQEIIAVSQTPPIIILQGDHGPKAGIASQSGRMEILNAYYLPGGGDTLYATITPVNSFRLIFNQYFGGQFELLPDISFFSTYQKPDVFTVYQNDPASCTP